MNFCFQRYAANQMHRDRREVEGAAELPAPPSRQSSITYSRNSRRSNQPRSSIRYELLSLLLLVQVRLPPSTTLL
jgi:hypothetical protein